MTWNGFCSALVPFYLPLQTFAWNPKQLQGGVLGKSIVRAMRNSLPWPLQREQWPLKRLRRPKRSINGMALNFNAKKANFRFSLSMGGLYQLRNAYDGCKSFAQRRKMWCAFLHALFALVRCEVLVRKDPKLRFWVSLVTCFTRREFGENAIANAT